MLPHPPEDHTRRGAAANETRPRADVAIAPFSRRVDLFARQIAALRRHASTLRRHAPARELDGPTGATATAELPADVLDDLLAALESLNLAEEELHQQHEELGAMRAALDRERLRYRSLFDEAPVPYLVTGVDGGVREANRAAADLLGVDAGELVRKPLAAYVAGADRRTFRERLASLPLAPGAQVEFSATLVPRRGPPIEALVTGQCLPDPLDAGVPLLRWVVRDVTAERAAEREIRRLNEHLESRVAARTADVEHASQEKSRFLATLSHEIRTPVTAVVGYADLLETEIGGPLTPAQRAYVERLRASTGHLLSLVEGVLDLAKVEAGRVTLDVRAWPVTAVVEDALSMVRPDAESRGVRLAHESGEGEGPCVLADEHRARQVLVNLLANAIRFTPAEGSVTVRCGLADRPPAAVAAAGPGPWVWTAIADTGVGITPSALDAVFEPFVQAEPTPERSDGSGLGLAISRRLARLMRGDLVAESEPGRGSVFTLWLPAAPAAR